MADLTPEWALAGVDYAVSALILIRWGDDSVSRPDPGALGVVDAGAVPALAAFEGADAAFAPGAPLYAGRRSVALRAWEGLPLRGMKTLRTPMSCSSSSTLFSP